MSEMSPTPKIYPGGDPQNHSLLLASAYSHTFWLEKIIINYLIL